MDRRWDGRGQERMTPCRTDANRFDIGMSKCPELGDVTAKTPQPLPDGHKESGVPDDMGALGEFKRREPRNTEATRRQVMTAMGDQPMMAMPMYTTQEPQDEDLPTMEGPERKNHPAVTKLADEVPPRPTIPPEGASEDRNEFRVGGSLAEGEADGGRRRGREGRRTHPKVKFRDLDDTLTAGTSADEETLQRQLKRQKLPSRQSDAGGHAKPRLCCSFRLLIGIMAFVAFLNGTLIRIGIVMAMVCMTHVRGRNVTVDDCPPLTPWTGNQMFEFSWSSSLQGFIKSGAFYGFLVGPFVSGFLSYRYGGKIVLIVGMLCAGVTYAVSPELARLSPYLLFAARVMSGFFGGLLYPATFDILSHWAVPEERQLLVGGALIGVPLCSVLNFPINGLLCMLFGWVSIFYFATVWLSLYSFAAYFVIFDYPEKCPYIKRFELDYIVPRTPGQTKSRKIPWGQIIRSIPLYAYIITHFCINYGFLTIILHLPVFMQDVYHFQLRSNSLLSAAPYLGALACRILTTFTFNLIKARLKVTTNSLRKAFVIIGVSVPSVALIAVSLIPCRYRYAALACFIVFATSLELSITSGYLLSLLDMCPSYSNILSGFANAIANSAGLLCAVFTGLITPNGTHEEWNNVFYVAIGFFAIAGMTYTTFGSNELQPWGLAKVIREEEVRTSIVNAS